MKHFAAVSSLIDWIHGARTFGEKKGLSNMERMLDALGHPERAFKMVHVAGTNGKGSVCAFLERALRENGYVTGLYTSPYLMRYQERMRISGIEVTDEVFLEQGNELYDAVERLQLEGLSPTAFELGTALAFMVFKRRRVEIAVIEVGLGGRLDPTNVITPVASAIANIGLDHTQILGDTLEQIAAEKAGIIKPGVPVALYPAKPGVLDVIERAAESAGAPLYYTGGLPVNIISQDAHSAAFETYIEGFGEITVRLNMAGRHQITNALLAVTALALMRGQGVALDTAKVLTGIEKASWLGRLSWAQKNILLDGAHNEQGAQALYEYATRYLKGRRIVMLTAMMNDKRPAECARILCSLADAVVTTEVDWPRAMPAQLLADIYSSLGVRAIPRPDIKAALELARELAGADALVLVCGSLYLIGDVFNRLQASGAVSNN